MSSQQVSTNIDDELSVPGHTALRALNRTTKAVSLSCDDCAVHLSRFVPDRHRERGIATAWREHLAAWCGGIRIAEIGADGRYVAAACGSTSTHASHWTDGRDYIEESR